MHKLRGQGSEVIAGPAAGEQADASLRHDPRNLALAVDALSCPQAQERQKLQKWPEAVQ